MSVDEDISGDGVAARNEDCRSSFPRLSFSERQKNERTKMRRERQRELKPIERKILDFLYEGWFKKSCFCTLSDKEIAHRICEEYTEVSSSVKNLEAQGFLYGFRKGCRFLLPSEKLFEFNASNLVNDSGLVRPEKVSRHKECSLFDYRVSRRFSKEIQRKLSRIGMRGLPAWSEKCADEVRKLREIDGFTEDEITNTLDFIVNDVKAVGFCFGKNIRSTSGIRDRWRSGLTKFETAYNAMKESKMANPNVEDPDSLPYALRNYPDGSLRRVLTAPFENDEDPVVREHSAAGDFYSELMMLPRPDWKIVDQRFLEWEQLCYDISMLLDEFVDDRGWRQSLFQDFLRTTNMKNPSLKFYTSDILRQKLSEFFEKWVEKGYSIPGRFMQPTADGTRIEFLEDSSYKDRIQHFLIDQKNLEPFKNATRVYEV